jgi:hypothetical protein
MKKTNSMAANLVAARGNRCSASILGWLEGNLYTAHPEITTQEQKAIRQTVLDNVNFFKDLAMDIVKSETSILNDEYAKKIDEIHQAIRYG